MAPQAPGIGSVGFGYVGGAVQPGGNIPPPAPYAPVAVEFLPHAFISQYPTAIADTGLLSASWWNWLPSGSALYDYFQFGPAGESLFRMNANPPYTNGALETFLVGPSNSQINVFNPGIPLGRWNHFFLNYRPDVGNGLWINGVHNATIPNTMGVDTLSVSGNVIGLASSFSTGGSLYSDFQCWFGTYIDPTGTYNSGGDVAVSPQPKCNGNNVNPNLVPQIVAWANGAGIGAQFPLTVANIESSLGTTDLNSKGNPNLFSFNLAQMQQATGTTDLFNNNTQFQAFQYYNTPFATPSGGQVSWTYALKRGPDPTGKNRYLSYNQGPTGSDALVGASDATTLSALSQSSGVSLGNFLRPSWVKGGPNNVWGPFDSDFYTALDGNSTVGQWKARFNAVFDNFAGNDAASRITPATSPNINAFIDANGNAVPPSIPAAAFGAQSLLFTGKAATYATNLGDGGVFASGGPALVDYPLPPP